MYRLIGDIRALGADPAQWRTHMVRKLRKVLDAEIVISSEVHVRAIPGQPRDAGGRLRITDVGWGCDGGDEKHVWKIHSETDSRPEEFMLALLPDQAEAGDETATLHVRPTMPLRGGKSFVLSQYPLPHLGTVDQLGVHRDAMHNPFSAVEHRLIRLFHVELGRLWRNDALLKARDPNSELPPRLAQTLAALQEGCSEKQVSLKLGISQHTVHNYVKALHQRLGVSSRGELLAKMPQPSGSFTPTFSVPRT
jgi:hypothetical protein